MTLRNFNQLSEAGKADEVALWGDLMQEWVASGHLVFLYKLHNFYVEVYMDPVAKRIRRYRACLHNLHANAQTHYQ